MRTYRFSYRPRWKGLLQDFAIGSMAAGAIGVCYLYSVLGLAFAIAVFGMPFGLVYLLDSILREATQ